MPGTEDVARRGRNRLFRNLGNGSFSDVTSESRTGHTGYGMGASCADYDNDGDSDIYVANFGPDLLLRNSGDGSFSFGLGSHPSAERVTVRWPDGGLQEFLDLPGAKLWRVPRPCKSHLTNSHGRG